VIIFIITHWIRSGTF